jgi:hypothetical protein
MLVVIGVVTAQPRIALASRRASEIGNDLNMAYGGNNTYYSEVLRTMTGAGGPGMYVDQVVTAIF